MSSILQEEIMHRVTRILRPPFYLLLMAFLFCAGMPDALAGDTIRTTERPFLVRMSLRKADGRSLGRVVLYGKTVGQFRQSRRF